MDIKNKVKELVTAVTDNYDNLLTNTGDINQDNLSEAIHEQINDSLIWTQDITELAMEGLINIVIEGAAITVTDVDELFAEVYSIASATLTKAKGN